MGKNDSRESEESRAPETPQISKDTWYALAVAGVVIAGILAITMAIWVFSAVSPKLMVQRAQAFTPFGVAMVAIVTFCTVVWRGLLTDEQVKEQRRQNDAKDDELLAKLLVDGAGLIGDEKEAKRMAGVSALQTVATAPSDRYASNAMDVLLSFIEERYAASPFESSITLAISAINAAADLRRSGRKSINITESEGTTTPLYCPAINGAKTIGFQRGMVLGSTLKQITDVTKYTFSKTTFSHCHFERELMKAFDCKFVRCTFALITTRTLQADCRNCDFSGAKITFPRDPSLILALLDLKRDNNFFYDDDPPKSNFDIDWANHLCVRPASERKVQRSE